MSRPIVFLLLIVSIVCYVIGISSPIATVQKDTLFTSESQQYSVVSSIEELEKSGELGLAILVAIFSILFPVAKYLSLTFTVLSGGESKNSGIFRIAKKLGKWSMLDVFVIALLIVMMKINGEDHWYLATSMTTEPGLFVYAFSVVLSMILASKIGVMKSNVVDSIELENGRIVRPCGFWIRMWANLIDGAIATAIVLPIMLKVYGREYLGSEEVIHGSADLIFNWILPLVVTIAFWAKWQATPGKLMIGAKVVDERTGRPVPIGRLVGRYFGYFLSVLPFGVGFLWVALDKRRQGWHDKVARTLVVESD